MIESAAAMRWAELIVETPSEAAEAVTAILLDAGCHGVAEQGVNPRVITGYLPVLDNLQDAIETIEDRFIQLPDFGLSAPTDFTLKYAEEADWANEWRKYFKPVEIGKRLVVKPTWEEYRGDPARLIVELDPGMAFGTGAHPTTRLCLELLEDYVAQGDVVADIGTGSGILSIAAARLGSSMVHATDIDLLPRKVARENAAANGLESAILVHEPDEFDAHARPCDLVVANILAGTIVELTPPVARRLKPGGTLIASGIVAERLADVLDAFAANGFVVREIREDDVWRAVCAELRADG